jgi:hypothetical protein
MGREEKFKKGIERDEGEREDIRKSRERDRYHNSYRKRERLR